MTEGWHLPDDDVPLTGEHAAALIQQRVARGLLGTWLAEVDDVCLVWSAPLCE
ncbi:MAG: hypothetical protein JWN52_7988 [Actinomycetia bacterium]|nr:hypothetical protein [Actinomycetes bacterium]